MIGTPDEPLAMGCCGCSWGENPVGGVVGGGVVSEHRRGWRNSADN